MARILGRCIASLANLKHPVWLKNALIRLFCWVYTVNHQEMARVAPHAYLCFNDFFTRELRAGARAITKGERTLVSPADGVLSRIDNHHSEYLIQAKQHRYSIRELLGQAADAQSYTKGSHFVVYLAPHNYHRVHMPLAGRLSRCDYLPGAFFAVNERATRMVSRLFTRNERLVCHFDCGTHKMAVIFVAAFLVGGISTVWQKSIVGRAGIDSLNQQCARNPESYQLKKGAELGHFQFGSTVIVLLSQSMRSITHDANTPCQMGQALGDL